MGRKKGAITDRLSEPPLKQARGGVHGHVAPRLIAPMEQAVRRGASLAISSMLSRLGKGMPVSVGKPPFRSLGLWWD